MIALLYRKKPVEIEAVQWFQHGDHPEVRRLGLWHTLAIGLALGAESLGYTPGQCGKLTTESGDVLIVPGDYILKGVKGEYYPCKAEVFELTYERASGTTELDQWRQLFEAWGDEPDEAHKKLMGILEGLEADLRKITGYRTEDKRAFDDLREQRNGLDGERDSLRESVKRLNRRCQAGEAAVNDLRRILKLNPDENGVRWVNGSLGRAFLATYAAKLEEELKTTKDELAAERRYIENEHVAAWNKIQVALGEVASDDDRSLVKRVLDVIALADRLRVQLEDERNGRANDNLQYADTYAKLKADVERLDWLSAQCYLPGEHPDDGLLVIVSEKYAKLGAFTCRPKDDQAALRAAIDAARGEKEGK